MSTQRSAYVSFRVTPDEHQRLVAEAQANGYSNLSDYARLQMLGSSTAATASLQPQVRALVQTEVQTEVEKALRAMRGD